MLGHWLEVAMGKGVLGMKKQLGIESSNMVAGVTVCLCFLQKFLLKEKPKSAYPWLSQGGKISCYYPVSSFLYSLHSIHIFVYVVVTLI
jgi:hypothetical protein